MENLKRVKIVDYSGNFVVIRIGIILYFKQQGCTYFCFSFVIISLNNNHFIIYLIIVSLSKSTKVLYKRLQNSHQNS